MNTYQKTLALAVVAAVGLSAFSMEHVKSRENASLNVADLSTGLTGVQDNFTVGKPQLGAALGKLASDVFISLGKVGFTDGQVVVSAPGGELPATPELTNTLRDEVIARLAPKVQGLRATWGAATINPGFIEGHLLTSALSLLAQLYDEAHSLGIDLDAEIDAVRA